MPTATTANALPQRVQKMNIFEDLVDELKEENLLESTIIDMENSRVAAESVVASDESPDEPIGLERSGDILDHPTNADATTAANSERESYKKRAVSEVSGLQMVEHVLTGVEREYMKVVPKTYDDLNAKKALHAFLNAADPEDAEAQSGVQHTLLQETEAWCTALGERDRDIPVASLRLYCENSKPALSSQALVGMARFYRNLPYSESVRSKFDFTITRLFSRPVDDQKRACLFDRDEMLGHIITLYREWSSVSLYTVDEDESKVLLSALSFEDLAIEAEQATTFDQLIESDFFGRLRLYKESIAEMFFAPNVTSAAIECNIRIGNAYVNLIHRERAKMDQESLESKYGDLNDQTVSDAAARTLKLVDLLRSTPVAEKSGDTQDGRPDSMKVVFEAAPQKQTKSTKAIAGKVTFASRMMANVRGVNKWFLTMSILLLLASVGVWVWANYVVVSEASTKGVQTFEIENSILAEHIKAAKISNGTLYGMLLPSWDTLPKEKREEFLVKVQKVGSDKGYTQVSLVTKDGKMAAFASATRTEVKMP